MSSKQLYEYAIDVATNVVGQVRADQLASPTPDTEWSVSDLLQHMVFELAWAADIVAGKTSDEVGDKYEGDLLSNDPVQAWRHYLVLTRDAVGGADERTTTRLSYADMPVGEYLMEAGNDELVHAWDLGMAIGMTVAFNERVAQILYSRALDRQAEIANSGLFGAPVPVGDNVSTQTKLLAVLGRPEDWKG
jgi:uncharacterized protein (TIGR03086 family)